MNYSNALKCKLWITAVILCISVTAPQYGVFAAPLDNENNETPFPLELQPPLLDSFQDAIDSYGNPITYSQPIETPDGRKVINAQGVQFEIPNYASGITEIKKPTENLLPPLFDPNAVAQQNGDIYNPDTDYSAPQQKYTLPDWLADLNDPDVGPGVPYTPSNDENSLKVLSWDLVPPNEQNPQDSTPDFGTMDQNAFPVTVLPNQAFEFSQAVPVTTNQPKTLSTTYKPNIIKTIPTTTTTPTPITTTTEAISISDSAEYFALPGGNSEFLPSWLEGFDDPELSIAVPFEVPEDNNEYNHTFSNNLLPPLEPFEDLKVLNVPGFPSPSQVQSAEPTSITAIPTTTPTPLSTTTSQPYSSTFKPFQFKFITKPPTNPPNTYTQNNFFNAPQTTTTIPTTTPSPIIKRPISNRISQFTLKSSAQPTGFKPNSFLATQSTIKPTVQPVFDPKFNPFFNSRIGQNTFANNPRITTTTAPTTSELIFGSVTTPSWLTGINVVNPGPGVPFSLAKISEQQATFNGFLPSSSQVAEQTVDGVTIQKSISSELPPLNFIHNSIPSQSTIPTNQPLTLTSTPLPEPSRLFTPPVVVQPDQDENAADSNLQSQTIPINNNNFPAATEPTTKPTSKVTFNKSDQGKVISNSVFEPVQQSTKPNSRVSQPTAPIGFTSATLSPGFPSQSSTAGTIFGGKYTGGFGGAPGFLGGQSRPGYAVQPDGSIRDPDHTVRPQTQVSVPAPIPGLNLQSRIDIPRQPAIATSTVSSGPKRAYTGTFGGPPGVLSPFDNVSGV